MFASCLRSFKNVNKTIIITQCLSIKSYRKKMSLLLNNYLMHLPHFLSQKKSPSIVWFKTNNNNKMAILRLFLPFFRQLYVYLSQNRGSDSHFEVLNRSKSWLVQELWHKKKIFPFPFFCDFVKKDSFAFSVILHFVS